MEMEMKVITWIIILEEETHVAQYKTTGAPVRLYLMTMSYES